MTRVSICGCLIAWFAFVILVTGACGVDTWCADPTESAGQTTAFVTPPLAFTFTETTVPVDVHCLSMSQASLLGFELQNLVMGKR